jgi:hypothetical protein
MIGPTGKVCCTMKSPAIDRPSAKRSYAAAVMVFTSCDTIINPCPSGIVEQKRIVARGEPQLTHPPKLRRGSTT